MFKIENRRYVGNKFKLSSWIKENITINCGTMNSVFDVFAGTGIVSQVLLDSANEFFINDFLYSNEVIYKGFFQNSPFRQDFLLDIKQGFNETNGDSLPQNYVSQNYGDKFFGMNDAKKIGYIRQSIEDQYKSGGLSEKEYCILLSSLLYSADRAANTVGHYDAYIKGKAIRSSFYFDLIAPFNTAGKKIHIYRTDSNILARDITATLAVVDPPYNSRQYSRFYHVLENLTKWEKPELFGVAMKPKEENMSEYCRNSASTVFEQLVQALRVKYIVVTYNNTYDSKSSSSRNKITLDKIQQILQKRGKTVILEKPYKFFNSGKTEFMDHKEMLFITEVAK